MGKAHQTHLTQLQKYAIFQEAVRWNEGFRQETDTAFSKFWEREGDSLKNRELIEFDSQGNRLSCTPLGSLMKEPDSDPLVLNAYCYSPDARQVQQRYGLLYPYHYNQPGLLSTPGQTYIVSLINADGFLGKIDGKTVWIFRSPCLQAVRDEGINSLDIKINLSWSKKEIMAVFEMVLNDALQKRESIGKKIKRRGVAVDEDALPFKAWLMHNKRDMTPWEITQELFPFTKGKSYQNWDENYSPEARSYLRKVERALKKAETLISSITPTT
ncbi:MAG: hypothetical protein FJ134_14560 [Deltaproteobacteria bacterium]|nr:hypothetical protein [Deltaproteobacteria bacterium]